MPYIEPAKRDALEPTLGPLCAKVNGLSDGELNYVLTSIVQAWIPDEAHYTHLSRGITALECAKLEFYRTRVSRYEDAAEALNGPLPIRRSPMVGSP